MFLLWTWLKLQGSGVPLQSKQQNPSLPWDTVDASRLALLPSLCFFLHFILIYSHKDLPDAILPTSRLTNSLLTLPSIPPRPPGKDSSKELMPSFCVRPVWRSQCCRFLSWMLWHALKFPFYDLTRRPVKKKKKAFPLAALVVSCHPVHVKTSMKSNQ